MKVKGQVFYVLDAFIYSDTLERIRPALPGAWKPIEQFQRLFADGLDVRLQMDFAAEEGVLWLSRNTASLS